MSRIAVWLRGVMVVWAVSLGHAEGRCANGWLLEGSQKQSWKTKNREPEWTI